jgi:hypothetical protein
MSQKIKILNEGRTTLPLAMADGSTVNVMADKYGRQVMMPYTVRELVQTASCTITNGTPTVLQAGVTGTKFDLVYFTAANTCGNAISITLSDDGTTVNTLSAPASTTNNGIVVFDPTIPIPQSAAAGAWRVDVLDDSGTSISVYALFIKN